LNTSAAFYGRSGTGKTTVACSYPGPILLLDVKDKGTASVLDVENLDILPVEKWDDFEDAYWYLHANPKEYATVVIDTVTNLQQVVVQEVSSRGKKTGGQAGDWGTMSRRQWGDVASRMKNWITNFRDLPLNVIFVAQDRVFNFSDEDDEGSVEDENLQPEVGPALSPAVAKHLNAAVSIIGNTFIRRRRTPDRKIKDKVVKGKEVTEYCMRLGPNPVYITKLRKPKHIEPPSILVDPTYEDIISLVKGA
jgi:phage nucleotide-binding protein